MFIILFCAAQAPDLFGRDQRHSLLSLYFARALRREDYALARMAGFMVAVFILQMLPHVVFFLGQVLLATDVLKGVTDDLPEMAAIKRDLGVPAALQSCHTSMVEGYVVEGHVPADVVLKLLKEKPRGVGLAVPGMPMGSPGMEGPTRDRYDILLFRRDGGSEVFASR